MEATERIKEVSSDHDGSDDEEVDVERLECFFVVRCLASRSPLVPSLFTAATLLHEVELPCYLTVEDSSWKRKII